MFSSLFGRKGQSRLYSIFQHLDEVEKGLASRIERYVLEGEDPTVVDRLSQFSDLQKMEAGISLVGYFYGDYDKKKADKRANEIRPLVGELASEPWMQDADSVRRLGLLAQGLYKNDTNQYYYCSVPPWLGSFVNYLATSFGCTKDKEAWLRHCGPDWFERVLRANEIETKQIFGLFLERMSYHRSDLANSYCESIDWSRVLKTQEFLAIVDAIHVSGRLKLISLVSKGVDLNRHTAFLMGLVTASSKEVRTEARKLLAAVELDTFSSVALASFPAFPAAQRKELAALLILQGNDQVIEQLQTLVASDKSKAVKDVVAKAVADLNASKEVACELVVPSFDFLPEPQPLSREFKELAKTTIDAALAKAKAAANDETESNKDAKYKTHWRKNSYDTLKTSAGHLSTMLAFLDTGQARVKHSLATELSVDAILKHPEFQLQHLIRLGSLGRLSLSYGLLPKWLAMNPNMAFDLRQLVDLLAQVGESPRLLAEWYLESDWNAVGQLPSNSNILFWPFFAQYTDYLDEAFGLRPSLSQGYRQFDKVQAMLVLRYFPVIPEKYLQIMYGDALSSSKTLGPIARETIESYGLVPARIFETLSSSKQDERIVAAEWIQGLGLKEAIEPIQKALKKERSETAKAALLSCLSSLGESIDSYLAPDALLAEAEKGLKKAIPKSISWFAFDAIPSMTWKMGDAVDPKVIQWWLVLAAKLKQPEGNPLLNLYLAELSQDSQRSLSTVIFEAFIKEDTQNPTDEEAASYATANQQHWFDSYQRWAEGDSDWAQAYKNKTLQDVYNELFKQKKSEYLGSAIAAKGILCLGGLGNAADLVQLISSYMKQHYTRRHQIEAMLSSLAHNDDPAAIQLMLSVARRHRTRSVQEKAKALIDVVADRNGWSQDELADRTIPSAGFDLGGSQVLELGSRPITIRLSDQFKPVIENEAGKVLKALPTPRKDDDEDKVKEAKKQFSTLKKELKQVVELQTARLYEAMCLGREWPFEEWEEYLFNHPIMTHITQRLVWVVTQGNELTTIRPTAERELIDIDDEEFEAGEGATIKVAHIGDLTAEQAKQWQQLIQEEKLKQPFGQLTMPKTALTDEMLKGKKLDYHLGWMTDTYVVRGVMTKLGYKRGEAEDAGFFGNYYKEFTSLNISAVFEFSGNCLPEELYPAAIYHMCFIKSDQHYGWSNENKYLSLAELPKTLVMEVMRDYETIAAKAAFDENWEKKCPW